MCHSKTFQTKPLCYHSQNILKKKNNYHTIFNFSNNLKTTKLNLHFQHLSKNNNKKNYACLYTFYKFYLIYSYISSQLSVRFRHHLSFYVLQWVFLSLIKKLVIKSVLWPTNSYPTQCLISVDFCADKMLTVE